MSLRKKKNNTFISKNTSRYILHHISNYNCNKQLTLRLKCLRLSYSFKARIHNMRGNIIRGYEVMVIVNILTWKIWVIMI